MDTRYSSTLSSSSLLQERGYRTACFGKWHLGLWFAARGGAPLSLTRPLPWDGGPLPDRSLSERIDFAQPVGGGPTTLGFDEAFYTAGCSTDQEPYCFIDGDRCLGMERAVYRRPRGSWRSGMTAADWDNETVDIEFTERAVAFIERQCGRSAGRPCARRPVSDLHSFCTCRYRRRTARICRPPARRPGGAGGLVRRAGGRRPAAGWHRQ